MASGSTEPVIRDEIEAIEERLVSDGRSPANSNYKKNTKLEFMTTDLKKKYYN